MADKHIRN